MPRINEGRDAGMNQERRRGIPLRPLALIEQNLDSHPPLMGFNQCLCNRYAGERIGLNKDGLTRLTQLLRDSLCTPPPFGEKTTATRQLVSPANGDKAWLKTTATKTSDCKRFIPSKVYSQPPFSTTCLSFRPPLRSALAKPGIMALSLTAKGCEESAKGKVGEAERMGPQTTSTGPGQS